MPENVPSNIAEAKRLIHSAESMLNDPADFERAIWRLVDAAGLVAACLTAAQRKGLAGIGEVTGRGFKLSCHLDR